MDAASGASSFSLYVDVPSSKVLSEMIPQVKQPLKTPDVVDYLSKGSGVTDVEAKKRIDSLLLTAFSSQRDNLSLDTFDRSAILKTLYEFNMGLLQGYRFDTSILSQVKHVLIGSDLEAKNYLLAKIASLIPDENLEQDRIRKEKEAARRKAIEEEEYRRAKEAREVAERQQLEALEKKREEDAKLRKEEEKKRREEVEEKERARARAEELRVAQEKKDLEEMKRLQQEAQAKREAEAAAVAAATAAATAASKKLSSPQSSTSPQPTPEPPSERLREKESNEAIAKQLGELEVQTENILKQNDTLSKNMKYHRKTLDVEMNQEGKWRVLDFLNAYRSYKPSPGLSDNPTLMAIIDTLDTQLAVLELDTKVISSDVNNSRDIKEACNDLLDSQKNLIANAKATFERYTLNTAPDKLYQNVLNIANSIIIPSLSDAIGLRAQLIDELRERTVKIAAIYTIERSYITRGNDQDFSRQVLPLIPKEYNPSSVHLMKLIPRLPTTVLDAVQNALDQARKDFEKQDGIVYIRRTTQMLEETEKKVMEKELTNKFSEDTRKQYLEFLINMKAQNQTIIDSVVDKPIVDITPSIGATDIIREKLLWFTQAMTISLDEIEPEKVDLTKLISSLNKQIYDLTAQIQSMAIFNIQNKLAQLPGYKLTPLETTGLAALMALRERAINIEKKIKELKKNFLAKPDTGDMEDAYELIYEAEKPRVVRAFSQQFVLARATYITFITMFKKAGSVMNKLEKNIKKELQRRNELAASAPPPPPPLPPASTLTTPKSNNNRLQSKVTLVRGSALSSIASYVEDTTAQKDLDQVSSSIVRQKNKENDAGLAKLAEQDLTSAANDETSQSITDAGKKKKKKLVKKANTFAPNLPTEEHQKRLAQVKKFKKEATEMLELYHSIVRRSSPSELASAYQKVGRMPSKLPAQIAKGIAGEPIMRTDKKTGTESQVSLSQAVFGAQKGVDNCVRKSINNADNIEKFISQRAFAKNFEKVQNNLTLLTHLLNNQLVPYLEKAIADGLLVKKRRAEIEKKTGEPPNVEEDEEEESESSTSDSSSESSSIEHQLLIKVETGEGDESGATLLEPSKEERRRQEDTLTLETLKQTEEQYKMLLDALFDEWEEIKKFKNKDFFVYQAFMKDEGQRLRQLIDETKVKISEIKHLQISSLRGPEFWRRVYVGETSVQNTSFIWIESCQNSLERFSEKYHAMRDAIDDIPPPSTVNKEAAILTLIGDLQSVHTPASLLIQDKGLDMCDPSPLHERDSVVVPTTLEDFKNFPGLTEYLDQELKENAKKTEESYKSSNTKGAFIQNLVHIAHWRKTYGSIYSDNSRLGKSIMNLVFISPDPSSHERDLLEILRQSYNSIELSNKRVEELKAVFSSISNPDEIKNKAIIQKAYLMKRYVTYREFVNLQQLHVWQSFVNFIARVANVVQTIKLNEEKITRIAQTITGRVDIRKFLAGEEAKDIDVQEQLVALISNPRFVTLPSRTDPPSLSIREYLNVNVVQDLKMLSTELVVLEELATEIEEIGEEKAQENARNTMRSLNNLQTQVSLQIKEKEDREEKGGDDKLVQESKDEKRFDIKVNDLRKMTSIVYSISIERLQPSDATVIYGVRSVLKKVRRLLLTNVSSKDLDNCEFDLSAASELLMPIKIKDAKYNKEQSKSLDQDFLDDSSLEDDLDDEVIDFGEEDERYSDDETSTTSSSLEDDDESVESEIQEVTGLDDLKDVATLIKIEEESLFSSKPLTQDDFNKYNAIIAKQTKKEGLNARAREYKQLYLKFRKSAALPHKERNQSKPLATRDRLLIGGQLELSTTGIDSETSSASQEEVEAAEKLTEVYSAYYKLSILIHSLPNGPDRSMSDFQNLCMPLIVELSQYSELRTEVLNLTTDVNEVILGIRRDLAISENISNPKKRTESLTKILSRVDSAISIAKERIKGFSAYLPASVDQMDIGTLTSLGGAVDKSKEYYESIGLFQEFIFEPKNESKSEISELRNLNATFIGGINGRMLQFDSKDEGQKEFLRPYKELVKYAHDALVERNKACASVDSIRILNGDIMFVAETVVKLLEQVKAFAPAEVVVKIEPPTPAAPAPAPVNPTPSKPPVEVKEEPVAAAPASGGGLFSALGKIVTGGYFTRSKKVPPPPAAAPTPAPKDLQKTPPVSGPPVATTPDGSDAEEGGEDPGKELDKQEAEEAARVKAQAKIVEEQKKQAEEKAKLEALKAAKAKEEVERKKLEDIKKVEEQKRLDKEEEQRLVSLKEQQRLKEEQAKKAEEAKKHAEDEAAFQAQLREEEKKRVAKQKAENEAIEKANKEKKEKEALELKRKEEEEKATRTRKAREESEKRAKDEEEKNKKTAEEELARISKEKAEKEQRDTEERIRKMKVDLTNLKKKVGEDLKQVLVKEKDTLDALNIHNPNAYLTAKGAYDNRVTLATKEAKEQGLDQDVSPTITEAPLKILVTRFKPSGEIYEKFRNNLILPSEKSAQENFSLVRNTLTKKCVDTLSELVKLNESNGSTMQTLDESNIILSVDFQTKQSELILLANDVKKKIDTWNSIQDKTFDQLKKTIDSAELTFGNLANAVDDAKKLKIGLASKIDEESALVSKLPLFKEAKPGVYLAGALIQESVGGASPSQRFLNVYYLPSNQMESLAFRIKKALGRSEIAQIDLKGGSLLIAVDYNEGLSNTANLRSRLEAFTQWLAVNLKPQYKIGKNGKPTKTIMTWALSGPDVPQTLIKKSDDVNPGITVGVANGKDDLAMQIGKTPKDSISPLFGIYNIVMSPKQVRVEELVDLVYGTKTASIPTEEKKTFEKPKKNAKSVKSMIGDTAREEYSESSEDEEEIDEELSAGSGQVSDAGGVSDWGFDDTVVPSAAPQPPTAIVYSTESPVEVRTAPANPFLLGEDWE